MRPTKSRRTKRVEEGVTLAPSLTVCAEVGCERPCWTTKRRGQNITVSDFCFEHSNVSMFDVPGEPPKPKPKRGPFQGGLGPFHGEVRRQRLAREEQPAAVEHPARFSTELLPVLGNVLAAWFLPVFDCYAGTGERLGQLCDEIGLPYSGTEIEPEFIVDRRVRQGNATDASTYPTGPYVVCTSPTYPNGMSDHFQARDDSKRHTYRQALATTIGHDRPLDRNNTGRYGVRNAGIGRYWQLVNDAVGHWPNRAVVNVKDFIVAGQVYPLDEKWQQLLVRHGYDIVERVEVACPGQRFGANRERVDHEVVLVAERAS
jgi:hypothetical protein